MLRSAAVSVLIAACALFAGCAAVLGIGDLDVPSDASSRDASDDSSATTKRCLSTCGSSGGEDCCASELVTGGTFLRDVDGVYENATNAPATISSFRLDRFEVTLGRFRAFVANIVERSWRPSPGSGTHAHLDGGLGLSIGGGAREPGWDAAWNAQLPTTLEQWTAALSCIPAGQPGAHSTWSESAGDRETEPINCLTWFEAYAFCIWDGGFLPSEAEWNYAAAGGGGSTGQRVYPWSQPPTTAQIDCQHAVFGHGDGMGGPAGGSACPPDGPHRVGASSPLGDGAFHQADLAGNLREWTLDFHAATTYLEPCVDCASLTPSVNRISRGGSFGHDPTNLIATLRASANPADRSAASGYQGARCARAP